MERIWQKTYTTKKATMTAVSALLDVGIFTEIAVRDDRGGNGGFQVRVTGPRAPKGTAGWEQVKGPMGELLGDRG